VADIAVSMAAPTPASKMAFIFMDPSPRNGGVLTDSK
jgi:hypothetical protein